MISLKNVLVLTMMLVATATFGFAQGGSYLATVYETQDANATDSLSTAKAEIYETYGIKIVDEPEILAWNEEWVSAISDVLAALPAEFVASNTKVISLIPSYMSIELKYNGYQGFENTAQIGQGALVPNPIYNRYFKKVYGNLPSDSDKIARFKTILVRAMAYCFMNNHPDVVSSWKAQFTSGEVSTKVYGPGSDKNLVIGQHVNGTVIDLAFAISRYCADGRKFSSNFSSRYDFIKENVMGGQEVSGWGDPTEIGNPDEGTGDNTDTNTGNGDNGGNSEPETTDGSRPPPEIPTGDYLPVVTETGIGTESTTIPEEQQHLNQFQQTAIAELFSELPKYFSTCTEAITFVPTSDTICAFSTESYVFVTQHSWYKPSFTDLNDDARKKRFKSYLLAEMTKAFLFFHPDVTKAWKEQFELNKTIDAKAGIIRSTVEYYSNSSWLNGVSRERFNFIKEKVMNNKTF